MVKSILSAVIVALLLTVGAIYEHSAVKREFTEFSFEVEQVYTIVNDKTAKEKDYARGLIENGGPAIDQVKKILGETGSAELFEKYLF